MAYQIPFGGILRSIMGILFYGVGGIWFITWGSSDPNYSWAIWLGILFFVGLYFVPSLIAQDVKYRIKELKNIDGKDDKIKIPHPHAFLIVLVNLFLGYTLIAWVICLFWAMTPGTVVIPRELEKYFDRQA